MEYMKQILNHYKLSLAIGLFVLLNILSSEADFNAKCPSISQKDFITLKIKSYGTSKQKSRSKVLFSKDYLFNCTNDPLSLQFTRK